ncbi:hypothetical protein LPJ54_006885, partial [Coemansia sp. RSA 1824]
MFMLCAAPQIADPAENTAKEPTNTAIRPKISDTLEKIDWSVVNVSMYAAVTHVIDNSLPNLLAMAGNAEAKIFWSNLGVGGGRSNGDDGEQSS